jgi:hypothetical protein
VIKYSLICDRQHAFEGWFSSGEDFDAQKKRNLVSCPICNSGNIEKTLMAPSISTSKAKAVIVPSPDTPEQSLPTAATQVPAGFSEAMAKMRDLREYIHANSEDVGNKFPDEARKIHYGDAEKRGIFGQASPQDVKELVEEGVEVMPLPILPEDRN